MNKKLQKYIIPNVLAMLGMSCYILADTFFISKAQGNLGIAALNLALPVYGLLFAIGSMIGVGSSIRYALSKATGNHDAKDYFPNAIEWDVIISLVFVALGVLCPHTVLRIMGADAKVLAVGTGYIRIVLISSPLFILNYVFTAFVRNDGAPNIAMGATLFSSLFNIVFDYVLMFPMDMGMNGAALATGLSPAVSILICMIHFFSKKNTVTFRFIVPSGKKLLHACQLGTAAFVGEIASGITTMVFNFILLGLTGNIAVAAYGVIANVALVGTSIFNGVSQGLQPLASEAHGISDHKAKRDILRDSLIIGLILSSILVIGINVFAGPLIQVFNSDNSEQMAKIAISGMHIYFVGYILASVNIIRAGYFSAVDRGMDSSIIAISRGIVAIVIFAFILSKIFGITGVWMAYPAAELFTLLLSLAECNLLKLHTS